MTFDVNKFLEGYKPAVKTGGFNVSKFLSEKYPTTQRQGKGKLDDSSELYNLAVSKGYQKDADRILTAQSGEQTKKIFSGGFISDIFDTLNALQYGVTGILKGRSFIEGVRTRQSFSDKDALGDNGIPGMIGGIALDIAVDPLTYVAPWTIAKKVPGVMKGLKAIKGALFGRRVVKTIKGVSDIAPDVSKISPDLAPLAKEARKYKSAEEFFLKSRVSREELRKQGIKSQEAIKNWFNRNIIPREAEKLPYAMAHRPRKVSPSYDISRKGIITKDVYTRPQLYADMTDETYQQSFKALEKIKNKPNANITIYRATPINELRTGDWVSLSKKYAEKEALAEGVKVSSFKVKAKDVFFAGDDINEFGYFGKQITQVVKGVKKVLPRTYKTIEGGTKAGKYLADKFVWMFGADPIYKQAYQKSVRNIAVGTQNIAKISRGIGGLTPEVSAKLLTKDKTGRMMRVGIKQLKKILTPEEFKLVKPAWKKIDDLGQEAVDLGLLSKAKFEENLGEYIKNAYTEFEQAKSKGLFSFMKVGIKGIKKRKVGLTPEKMAELGQIDNPAYLLFKSVFDLTKDVENAKLFKATAKHFGSDVAQAGFKQLPKGIRVGALKGKWVPKNIYNAIQEVAEPMKDFAGQKIMGNFKFFKVVMNPATHARNMVSNQILNYWKLGMNPLDPRVIKANARAVKEVARGTGKYIKQAKKAGYNIDTFAANELRSILDSPEALGVGKKLGTGWHKVKNKLGDIYQGEENLAKLSAFIFNRKHRGLGIEDAWKAAESATFNYAQVTPFIRKLRTALWGVPFVTFTAKATPLAIETALKAPQRISVFGKVKQAIESQSDIETTERERAAEAPWIKDNFYIKLPIKDKYGRSAYFDLTYIIPFGDLVAGNFFERQTMRETGLRESIPSAVLSKSPLFGFIKEISRNQDFYGDKIWNDSDTMDKQLQDLMRHTTKTYLPPLVSDQIPGGYKSDGTRRQKGVLGVSGASAENQQRTLMQEMLRNVGAKVQPIDADIQERYQEWNKKKALKALLEEKGVIKEFGISYIPKK